MNRLREPSTWAGFAALLLVAKGFVPPHYSPLVDVLVTAAGGAAAVIAERGAPKP